MKLKKKAIVLLSGGLDSTTTLATAIHDGYSITCITFDYNQNNRFEIDASKKIAKAYQVKRHLIIDHSFEGLGESMLLKNTKANEVMSKKKQYAEMISTYVPFRNLFFLTYASAIAEKYMIGDIFFGANAQDHRDFPDCRSEFIQSFQKTVNIGSKFSLSDYPSLKIHAPLIEMNKAEIIKKGKKLGVDYSLTFTCYFPDSNGYACGICDACTKRLAGFREINIKDPARYSEN